MNNRLIELASSKRKSNFLSTFIFLPKEKRNAMNIVYDFCRVTDDIVDTNQIPVESKLELLNEWRMEFARALSQQSDINLLNNLAETIQKFKIPVEHFNELMNGMEMDLKINRYNTFEELYKYCYRVASTVGLISIHIFEFKDNQTKEYAINLGIALQLTNILRDLKEDLLYDRIYLPLEDFREFNYTEDEFKNHITNNNYFKLMQFEVERAQHFFDRTDSLLSQIDRKNLYPAEAMKNIYWKLLSNIRKNNYDVFKKRISIPTLQKLTLIFNSWLQSALI